MADETPPVDGGGFLSGKRGWIIIIAAVLFEAVIFGGLLMLKGNTEPPQAEDSSTGINRPADSDYLRDKIPLTELVYSIPTANGNPATLSLDLIIILGPSERELSEKITITPADWDKFHSTVDKMVPLIKDRLITRVSKMPVDELQSPRGQQQIKDFVKEFVNSELEKIDLKLSSPKIKNRRVQEVLITNFFLQV
jgi:flagellar basal body-associated protein FliL